LSISLVPVVSVGVLANIHVLDTASLTCPSFVDIPILIGIHNLAADSYRSMADIDTPLLNEICALSVTELTTSSEITPITLQSINALIVTPVLIDEIIVPEPELHFVYALSPILDILYGVPVITIPELGVEHVIELGQTLGLPIVGSPVISAFALLIGVDVYPDDPLISRPILIFPGTAPTPAIRTAVIEYDVRTIKLIAA